LTRPLLLAASTVLLAVAAGCGSDSATTTGSQAASSTGVQTSAPSSASTSSGFAATDSNPAGDIPDTQAFIPVTDTQSRFTVQVPEGWARRDQGAASTFTDHYNSIRLETVAAASAPTVDSARSAEVPAITAGGGNVAAPQVTSTQRTAGTVVLITYTADSAPDPVTGKVARESVERYEYWRTGVEAILTLASPVGADNVDPWRKVTDSFRWTP
jgi:hypothetical protein